ncbi:MAG: tryptophan synthase subunit alpha [Anaerolineae bacterium]
MGARGSHSRLAAAFAAFRERKRIGLFAYLTVGFPSLAASGEVAEALVGAGIDGIELGIPFSDPLADGPTIQAAAATALSLGVTTEMCLRAANDLRANCADVPIMFMGYYNPILQYGPARFVAAAVEAGADGVIVPDLPLEEAEELDEPCRELGLGIVPIASPVTKQERMRLLANRGAAFLYITSRLGVTGSRSSLATDLAEVIGKARVATTIPLAVGFGISRPEHVAGLKGLADAASVGSALLEQLGNAGDAAKAAAFAAALVEATYADQGINSC